MAGVEIFPSYLMNKDNKDGVIFFLQQLPIPPMRKKELAIQWSRFVGAAIDRDFIEQVVGHVLGGWE